MSRSRPHLDHLRQSSISECVDLVDLVEVGGVFVPAERARAREVRGLVMALLGSFFVPWRILNISESRWQLFRTAPGKRAAALRLAPLFLVSGGFRHFTDALVTGKESSMLAAALFMAMLALMSRLGSALSSGVTLIYMGVSTCADIFRSLTSIAILQQWPGLSWLHAAFPIWEVAAAFIAIVCMVQRTMKSNQQEAMRL